jgi:hypothetical protein
MPYITRPYGISGSHVLANPDIRQVFIHRATLIISFKESINFLVSQFATRLPAIHYAVNFSRMEVRQDIKTIFLKRIEFLTMNIALTDDFAISLNRFVHRFANASKTRNGKSKKKKA